MCATKVSRLLMDDAPGGVTINCLLLLPNFGRFKILRKVTFRFSLSIFHVKPNFNQSKMLDSLHND